MFMQLRTAIDGLYAAFAGVPRPDALSYCGGCCLSDEEARVLLEPRPVRDVPGEALWFYRVFLLSTVGAVADYRYFLPRILELTAEEAVRGGAETIYLEQNLQVLATAGWLTWADSERAAVDAYLRALWACMLDGGCAIRPDELVTAIGATGYDLAPLLAEWESSLSLPVAAERLAALLDYYDGDQTILSMCTDPAQSAVFAAWLTGEGLRRALAAATPGSPHLAVIEQQLDELAWLSA